MPSPMPTIALVADPRFAGGTSAAVAREITTLQDLGRLSVAAIRSRMFRSGEVNPLIAQACEDTATPLTWDPAVISADVVVVHNPSFLKFDTRFLPRIFCRALIVVCHENFLRPGGAEGFDVGHCLRLLHDATVTRTRLLAPVSGWNRTCAARWLEEHPTGWALTEEDWTNICDFSFERPAHAPRDRRGRHSRPGMEKFPPIDDLVEMFPESAETVRLLGADSLFGEDCPAHWELLRFGAEPVADFLRSIDFMVYFTNPAWRESFGRAIAEAMAAGKVVITDPETARTFGKGVVAVRAAEVSGVIDRMIASPELYRAQAEAGQAALDGFSRDAFLGRANRILNAALSNETLSPREKIHALL